MSKAVSKKYARKPKRGGGRSKSFFGGLFKAISGRRRKLWGIF